MEGYPQVVAGVVRPGRFERPTFCSPMLFTRSGPAFCCFPVRSILSIPPGLLDGVVDGVLNLLGLADNNCLRRRPHTPDFTRSSLFSSSFLAPAYFSRSATDNLANQHSVPPACWAIRQAACSSSCISRRLACSSATRSRRSRSRSCSSSRA